MCRSPTTFYGRAGTTPPSHLKTFDPNAAEKKKALPKVQPPPSVTLELLPFQQEGLGWMLSQEKGRLGGGILADQMGMGKKGPATSLPRHCRVTAASLPRHHVTSPPRHMVMGKGPTS